MVDHRHKAYKDQLQTTINKYYSVLSIGCISDYLNNWIQYNYGPMHEHVKFGLSNPSLTQSALTSHGSIRQGSGTVRFNRQVE